MDKPNKQLLVKTPKHSIKVDCYYDFCDVNDVKTNKELFLDMCKKGCGNYDNKYSCPPFSPSFEDYTRDVDFLLVLVLKADVSQLVSSGYSDYHKVSVLNAVLKPRIEKVMRSLEESLGGNFLSTGSCRLCKPCQRKLRKPCKRPEKMRFSLESLGVDCNHLSNSLFNLPLLWYAKGKSPKYTLVICALPLKQRKDEEILNLLNKKINEFVV